MPNQELIITRILVMSWHRYVVSSLLDMAYSIQILVFFECLRLSSRIAPFSFVFTSYSRITAIGDRSYRSFWSGGCVLCHILVNIWLSLCRLQGRFLGNLFFSHKVLGVSVLSFKGDKVLQEVSTSRVLLSSGNLSTSLLLGFQVLETGLLDFFQQFLIGAGYRQVKVLEFFDCPGPRQGVEDLRELLHKVELQGAQGDREAEVFQVSNDDTAVAQRWLEDKQPVEKTKTVCLVKEQEKEYQTGWKIKTGNVLIFKNQRSTQQCTKSGVAKYLGVAVIQQQNGLVKETNVTVLAKVRCFLIQSGLSKVLWAEDTTMSTYLVNKVTIISD
ncbi:hypothetical protein Tco_0511196 [Tanacetum coccineum]